MCIHVQRIIDIGSLSRRNWLFLKIRIKEFSSTCLTTLADPRGWCSFRQKSCQIIGFCLLRGWCPLWEILDPPLNHTWKIFFIFVVFIDISQKCACQSWMSFLCTYVKIYLSMLGSIFRIFDPWCQDRRSVFRVRRVKVSVFTDQRDGFPGEVQESPKSKLILWYRLKRIFA